MTLQSLSSRPWKPQLPHNCLDPPAQGPSGRAGSQSSRMRQWNQASLWDSSLLANGRRQMQSPKSLRWEKRVILEGSHHARVWSFLPGPLALTCSWDSSSNQVCGISQDSQSRWLLFLIKQNPRLQVTSWDSSSGWASVRHVWRKVGFSVWWGTEGPAI